MENVEENGEVATEMDAVGEDDFQSPLIKRTKPNSLEVVKDEEEAVSSGEESEGDVNSYP